MSITATNYDIHSKRTREQIKLKFDRMNKDKHQEIYILTQNSEIDLGRIPIKISYICRTGSTQIFKCPTYINLTDGRKSSCIFSNDMSSGTFEVFYDKDHDIWYQMDNTSMSIMSKMGGNIITNFDDNSFDVPAGRIIAKHSSITIQQPPIGFADFGFKALKWNGNALNNTSNLLIPLVIDSTIKILLYSKFPINININDVEYKLAAGWNSIELIDPGLSLSFESFIKFEIYIDEIVYLI